MTDYEALHGPCPALQSLLCSARNAAAYEREQSSHEGLGLATYTHFTSPIRRYADLIVHRALLAEIGAEEVDISPRYTELPALGVHLSTRTVQAKRLERRAEAVCQLSYLRRRLKREEVSRRQMGTIVAMSAAGCFVAIDGIEGLLAARALGGQPNAECTIWHVGAGQLRLGASIAVRIKSINPVRGQVELVPDQSAEVAPPAARAQAS